MKLATIIKMDENNRITIPTLYIKSLNLEKGDKIYISVDDKNGNIVIKKLGDA